MRMTKTYATFLLTAVAAGFLALLPSPDAQAQISVYYGGKLVYAQKTGIPDSAQFVFNASAEVKSSQERDPSTVGGAIAKESDAVDLGLPSGIKWAPWNIGAKAAGEAGAYFAWGEVQAGKEKYNWSTYWWIAEGQNDWQHINKYQIEDKYIEGYYDVLWYDGTDKFIGDGKATLEKADDAATVNWGSKWRMPTADELQELCDYCTWEWKEEGVYATNSLAGYLVTGHNGKSIFLPAAGYWSYGLWSLGSDGGYWSSSLGSGGSYGWSNSGDDFSGGPTSARSLNFYSNGRYVGSSDRYCGISVRAVASAAE